MGLTPIATGELAAIVTSLEMRERPPRAPLIAAPLRLERWQRPSSQRYRALFERVGAPWLWFSRLAINDAALRTILDDEAVMIWAVLDPRGIEIGLLELDFRSSGACEIAFLGLVPELAGKGHGRWLMAHALAAAWRADVTRVWVHTCSLDHPSALGFYQRQGFVPYARAVEVFADPRLVGLLPRDAAPHIPLIEP